MEWPHMSWNKIRIQGNGGRTQVKVFYFIPTFRYKVQKSNVACSYLSHSLL